MSAVEMSISPFPPKYLVQIQYESILKHEHERKKLRNNCALGGFAVLPKF